MRTLAGLIAACAAARRVQRPSAPTAARGRAAAVPGPPAGSSPRRRRPRRSTSRSSPTGSTTPGTSSRRPDGTLLVDERAGGFTAVLPDGTVREVAADFGDLFARGETGLMGLALDPAFAEQPALLQLPGRRGRPDDPPSIAVIAWTVDPDWSSATRVADPLIGGIPVNERSGRHGGCRLRFDARRARC